MRKKKQKTYTRDKINVLFYTSEAHMDQLEQNSLKQKM